MNENIPTSSSNSFPGYIFDTYSDRERLFAQFELAQEQFNLHFDNALKLGGLSTNPAEANWRVLDVGCGEGLFSNEVIFRYPKVNIVAFDRDPEAIMTANMAFGPKGDLHFFVHDALKPIPPVFVSEDDTASGEKFDVVFVILVLMHLVDPGAALANLYKALKPGGVIFLCDPPANSTTFPHPAMMEIFALFDKAWQLSPAYDFGSRHPEELRKAGFQDIQSTTYEAVLGGPSTAGRIMLSHVVHSFASMRRALVDQLKFSSGEEFDNKIARVKQETTTEMVGNGKTFFTIARKPVQ